MKTWRQHFPQLPQTFPELNKQQALLLWGLIVAAAMLSFFVHVLNGQVERSATVREQFGLSGTPQPSRMQARNARRAGSAEGSRQVASAR